jgi:hypothetical protein
MDAAFAVLKKTAFFLAFALLVAMPRLAQADAPTFTSPAANQSIPVGRRIDRDSRERVGRYEPADQLPTWSVTYAGGDPHWLAIGGDTGTTGTACNGGTNYLWDTGEFVGGRKLRLPGRSPREVIRPRSS